LRLLHKNVTLINDWKRHQISLNGIGLTGVTAPFGVIVTKDRHQTPPPSSSSTNRPPLDDRDPNHIVFFLKGVTIDNNLAVDPLPVVTNTTKGTTSPAAVANTTTTPTGTPIQNTSTRMPTTTTPSSQSQPRSQPPYLYPYPYPYQGQLSPYQSQQPQQQRSQPQQRINQQPPIANAGISQTVYGGTIVTLDGRSSYDPDNYAAGGYANNYINNHGIAAYEWTQIPITTTSGLQTSTVILQGANTATPTFVSPILPYDTILAFSLKVMDSDGRTISSNPAIVYVYVKHNPNNNSPTTGGSYSIPQVLL
jgi:hypothetical protein